MAVYYRLSELGFRLPAGSAVIPRDQLQPVAAATKILAEAEKRAAETEAAAKVAYEAERQRGYREGLELARAEAAGRLVEESRLLDRGLASLETGLSHLVAGCVRKLLAGFDDAAKTEAVVQFALKQMRGEARAELRVPPALAGHFKAKAESLRAEFPDLELIEVIEDSGLRPRQIIVETPIGRVDGDFDERLDDLERALLMAHARAAADELDAALRPPGVKEAPA